MATAPQYAATIKVGSAAVSSSADNTWTSPTNQVSLLTGGTNGTDVFEIDLQGIGTTVAGIINLALYDGTTYHMFDQVLVAAVTPSTTALAWRSNPRQYTNLFIPSNTWSLRAWTMVASQLVKITAFGADL